MDLLAYSHARPAGRIVSTGSRLVLRVVVSATSVLRTGAASLATNPEEPDDLDREVGLHTSSADGTVTCTASGGRWRFAVGNVPFDVEPGRPLIIAPQDWARAMIEVVRDGRSEWIAPPRIVAQAYLATERSVEALPLATVRVDLDAERARLRTVWRGERGLRPRHVLGRVVVVTDRDEGPLPAAELERRTDRFSPAAALFRATTEGLDAPETEDGSGTFAGDVAVLEGGALPFQVRADAGATSVSAGSSPDGPPSSPTAPAGVLSSLAAPAEAGERLTLGQRLAHRTAIAIAPRDDVPEAARDARPTLEEPAPRLLWAESDIARRVRAEPALRAWWPRVRRAENDGPGSERARRELGRLLRDMPRTPLANELLASTLAAAAIGSAPSVSVRGWLEPALDEVAMLRALVAATAVWRGSHAAVEGAASAAEAMLGRGGLDDLPSLVDDASARLLEAVESTRPGLATRLRAAATAGLVRGRKYAQRVLEGAAFVRASLVGEEGEGPFVSYLHVDGAERLPLLGRIPVVALVTVGPAMEEGDAGPSLWIHALGRDMRA